MLLLFEFGEGCEDSLLNTRTRKWSKNWQFGMERFLQMRKMRAWKDGVVTFTSFILFGWTLLLSYVVWNPFTYNPHYKFAAACVATQFAVVIIGLAKANSCGEKVLGSALTVLSNERMLHLQHTQ